MGKDWDHDKGGRNNWIKWMTEIMVEAKRCIKPGGHLFVWALPRTSHWTATALEDAGFEVRDIVTHVFGSGFPKSLNVGKNINKIWNKKIENVSSVEKSLSQRIIQEMDGQNFAQGSVLVKVKEKDMIEFVKIVEPNFTFQELMLNEQKDPAEHFVVLNVKQNISNNLQVQLIQIGKVDYLNGQMDIYQLTSEMENKDLSTISLWRLILDENLKEMKKYTTLTSLEMIIGLKIYNFLRRVSTLNYINGLGTGLKPAAEHWILCRKPLSEKTIAENVLKWGVGGINIDGSRVGTNDKLEASKLTDIRGADLQGNKNGQKNGKFDRLYIPNSEGRFPANFIHDGSDEVMEEFDKAGHSKSNTIKGEIDRPGGIFIDENGNSLTGHKKKVYSNTIKDEGSAARFFYCSKASGKERNEGLDEFDDKKKIFFSKKSRMVEQGTDKDEPSKGMERFETISKNNHPTVKAVKLMTYLINMITPPNGIVLDPFMGSGSTGVAAVKAGFNFIGIEMNAEYMEIAKARIKNK